MNKPKMILFDYGETLLSHGTFDGVKGTNAVLKFAVSNKHGMTAEEIQAYAEEVNCDIGRYKDGERFSYTREIHNRVFQQYLYESLGIEFSISSREIEDIFWDNASPAKPTLHIAALLDYLQISGIRTGVISNISFSGAALSKRINRELPYNHFEFIIASSEYIFRKPQKRIFDLALVKADLDAKDVWYCGNDVYYDVEGAENSSLFPVLYTGASDSNHPEPSCNYLNISDWADMIEVLQKL